MSELSQEKPLVELIEAAQVSITEEAAENSNDLIKIQGVGSRGGVVNRNGRMYPAEVLKQAVQEAQSSVRDGSFTGELEHSDLPMGSLERTAMRMTALWMDQDRVLFEAVLLNTPAGQALRSLLEGGVRIGMSTRGVGSVRWVPGDDDETGEIALVETYALYGIDAVKMPSNADGLARLKESIEGLREPHSKEESMTLKELREAHPELIKQIEEEARTSLQEQVNDLTSKVEERDASVSDLTAKLEETQSSLQEAQEVRSSVRKALLDAGVIKEEEATDADTSEMLESVRAERDKAAKERDQLNESLRVANDKLESEANQRARQAKLDELLKESEYAEFIAESVDIPNLESDEAVETEVTRLTNLAERVRGSHGRTEDTPGKGVLKESRTQPAEDDDEVARLRRLAGLS